MMSFKPDQPERLSISLPLLRTDRDCRACTSLTLEVTRDYSDLDDPAELLALRTTIQQQDALIQELTRLLEEKAPGRVLTITRVERVPEQLLVEVVKEVPVFRQRIRYLPLGYQLSDAAKADRTRPSRDRSLDRRRLEEQVESLTRQVRILQGGDDGFMKLTMEEYEEINRISLEFDALSGRCKFLENELRKTAGGTMDSAASLQVQNQELRRELEEARRYIGSVAELKEYVDRLIRENEQRKSQHIEESKRLSRTSSFKFDPSELAKLFSSEEQRLSLFRNDFRAEQKERRQTESSQENLASVVRLLSEYIFGSSEPADIALTGPADEVLAYYENQLGKLNHHIQKVETVDSVDLDEEGGTLALFNLRNWLKKTLQRTCLPESQLQVQVARLSYELFQRIQQENFQERRLQVTPMHSIDFDNAPLPAAQSLRRLEEQLQALHSCDDFTRVLQKLEHMVDWIKTRIEGASFEASSILVVKDSSNVAIEPADQWPGRQTLEDRFNALKLKYEEELSRRESEDRLRRRNHYSQDRAKRKEAVLSLICKQLGVTTDELEQQLLEERSELQEDVSDFQWHLTKERESRKGLSSYLQYLADLDDGSLKSQFIDQLKDLALFKVMLTFKQIRLELPTIQRQVKSQIAAELTTVRSTLLSSSDCQTLIYLLEEDSQHQLPSLLQSKQCLTPLSRRSDQSDNELDTSFLWNQIQQLRASLRNAIEEAHHYKGLFEQRGLRESRIARFTELVPGEIDVLRDQLMQANRNNFKLRSIIRAKDRKIHALQSAAGVTTGRSLEEDQVWQLQRTIDQLKEENAQCRVQIAILEQNQRTEEDTQLIQELRQKVQYLESELDEAYSANQTLKKGLRAIDSELEKQAFCQEYFNENTSTCESLLRRYILRKKQSELVQPVDSAKLLSLLQQCNWQDVGLSMALLNCAPEQLCLQLRNQAQIIAQLSAELQEKKRAVQRLPIEVRESLLDESRNTLLFELKQARSYSEKLQAQMQQSSVAIDELEAQLGSTVELQIEEQDPQLVLDHDSLRRVAWIEKTLGLFESRLSGNEQSLQKQLSEIKLKLSTALQPSHLI